MTPERIAELLDRLNSRGSFHDVLAESCFCPSELRELLEAYQGQQWRPIETAPTTHEWILLGYFPEYMEGKCQGGHPAIAYWDEWSETWVDCCGRKLRKEGAFSPTHWMPFAAAPEPGGDES